MPSFKTARLTSTSSSNYLEGMVYYTVKDNGSTVTVTVHNMVLYHSTGWKETITYSYWTSGTLQSGDSHISNSASVTDKQYVGKNTDLAVGTQTKTFKKTSSAYNLQLYGRMAISGTNYDGNVTITIPATPSLQVLNLKTLLTQLCQSLIVETGTPPITTIKGTLVSASYTKFHHIVQLDIEYHNTSSVASGDDVFTGTLTNPDLRPIVLGTGISYYSNKTMVGTLGEDTGNIIIRNAASTSIAANSTSLMSFTYIVR